VALWLYKETANPPLNTEEEEDCDVTGSDQNKPRSFCLCVSLLFDMAVSRLPGAALSLKQVQSLTTAAKHPRPAPGDPRSARPEIFTRQCDMQTRINLEVR